MKVGSKHCILILTAMELQSSDKILGDKRIKKSLYLEGLPSLGRPCDIHDSSSAQYMIGVPDFDAVVAHHLRILEGNFLHLTPVAADEQCISHIVWVHHKEEDHALVHVAQRVAKDKNES